MRVRLIAGLTLLLAGAAHADPSPRDRVYTADQNSNTVSVFDPSSNTLLGQIKLGNQRPDVLSPLYKGQVNVHGLGFSPDSKTLIAISTVTNSATFIDTATNAVKGVAYVGRNPHEGFFTPDGKEAWIVVRGEDYLAVIDPKTFKETGRIKTTSGPGMVIFSKDGKLAFVANSFNPVVDVVDIATRRVIKSISVVSPFSPFIQITPNGREAWLTHKDVGKVTRIDTASLEVVGVIDTGPITNHLTFAASDSATRAYVTIGGENAVNVYSTDKDAKLITTIKVGALPHGIWSSGDGSRVYVGLENGDGVDVIETKTNTVVKHILGGQAPQALVYIPDAAGDGDPKANLMPRLDTPENITLKLKAPKGDGAGYVVSRNVGLVDILEIGVRKLKPETAYGVVTNARPAPIAVVKTDKTGAGTVSVIGPTREIRPSSEKTEKDPLITIVEHDGSKFLGEPSLLQHN